MSIFLDISREIREKTVGTDEDFDIVSGVIASHTPEERKLYYDEYDLFDQLSGEACPTLQNIERYDSAIEVALER